MARSLSLDLPDALDYDEWARVGRKLAHAHNATPWMLGDWLLFGQFTYGQRYRDAAAGLGLEEQTLRVYAMVAGQFSSDRRRAAVPFTLHRVVCGLPLADRERLLDAAEAGAWSYREMDEAAAEVRAALRAPASLADDDAVPQIAGAAPVGATVEVAVVTITVAPSTQNRWATAAASAGVGLEAWIAAVLDTAAESALAGAAA